VVREFPLRSKAADRGMGTTWARGGGDVRRTERQWRLGMLAPASSGVPRGTGLRPLDRVNRPRAQ
jgi:hypothetical protein